MKRLVLTVLMALAVVGGGFLVVTRWGARAPETPVPGVSPNASPPPGMVMVPAGKFRMGSDDRPLQAPAHEVMVDAFFIDTYPVTNEQFRAFALATGHKPKDQWEHLAGPGREKHPAVHVRWDEAAAYARWAGKRLPTEAEWEKAARGTDGRVYPWGNDIDLSRLNLAGRDTTPVDAFPGGRSPYGVTDLAGNVFEWTADRLRPDRLFNFWHPVELQPACIIKGGCYLYDPLWCENAYFFYMAGNRSSYLVGFRCARSTEPVRAAREVEQVFSRESLREKGPRDCNVPYDEALRQVLDNGALDPAKEYHARYMRDFMGLRETLAAKGHLDIADIGSGPGYPSLFLARDLGPRATLHAVDIDPSVVRYLGVLKERAGAPNLRPVLSAPTDVTLPPASMDLVFCLGTYTYMVTNKDETFGTQYQKQAVPFLRSIHRALKPGGTLVMFNATERLECKRAQAQAERCGFKLMRKEFKRDELEKYSLLFKKTAGPE